jgi:phage terminase large subunit
MMMIDWQLPQWAEDFLSPARYKGAYGGRGSGKSESFARCFLLLSIKEPDANFLCVREIQKSIDASVKKLLDEIIQKLNLQGYFESMRDCIYRIHEGKRCGQFIFRGLRDDTAADSLKSMYGIKYVWIEEAHSVSKYGWQILTPTIRSSKSEIWATWNPDSEHDPIDKFFRKDLPSSKIYQNKYIVKKVNFNDNPWFDQTPLYEEMLLSKETDPDNYEWIWKGKYNKKTKSQVFELDHNYFILDSLTFDDIIKQKKASRRIAHGYVGIDWGTNDPMAVIKSYVDTVNKEIFVVREFYQTGVDVENIPAAIKKILMHEKDNRFKIADHARPDLIKLCNRHGLGILPAKKGQGSVAEGISKLKRFTIYIHERCVNLKFEMEKYSYKVDKNGEIQNEFVDKYNHAIDALRYMMEKVIEKGYKDDD